MLAFLGGITGQAKQIEDKAQSFQCFQYLKQLDNYLFFPKIKGELSELTWGLLGASTQELTTKREDEFSKLAKEILGKDELSLYDPAGALFKILKIDTNESSEDYRDFSQYLFYKVDFILWYNAWQDNRSEKLTKFLMKSRNSIEHVAPQTPDSDNKALEGWTGSYLHGFGNLALVSVSENSAFGNVSYDEKRAKFMNKHETAQVNQLKLALIYGSDKWNDKLCNEHLETVKCAIAQYLEPNIQPVNVSAT